MLGQILANLLIPRTWYTVNRNQPAKLVGLENFNKRTVWSILVNESVVGISVLVEKFEKSIFFSGSLGVEASNFIGFVHVSLRFVVVHGLLWSSRGERSLGETSGD